MPPLRQTNPDYPANGVQRTTCRHEWIEHGDVNDSRAVARQAAMCREFLYINYGPVECRQRCRLYVRLRKG